MKSIKLTINDKEVIVKQLPLRRYSELLAAIHDLPKNLGGLAGLKNDEIFEQLPAMISQSIPDLIGILSIATDLPQGEIEELGLNDATSLLAAVIEVNDYTSVFNQVKKIMASSKKEIPSSTN